MKAAIIGLGIIGQLHTEILKKQNIDIIAVCDIDTIKLNDFNNKHNLKAAYYENYKKMIDENIIDVVHICTPHYLHAEMVIYALKKNINVLCEKPLCISQNEIDAILKAEKESNGILGVVLQHRYNKANIYVKNFVADKKILTSQGTVVWQRDAQYYNQAEWRGKLETEGGGVMINQAIHTLDIVEWFCGEPDFVTASTDNYSLKGVIEVEDTASAKFSGKADFTFFATNSSRYNLPIEITLLTEKDTIKIINNVVLINNEIITLNDDEKNLGKAYYGYGHSKLISDFYNNAEKKQKFWIDGFEGSKVIKLILAMYRSKGQKITIY